MSTILLLILHIIRGIVCGSTREVLHLCGEQWGNNQKYCNLAIHEGFKLCVTQKRRSLPVPFLGFKSISRQCVVTPINGIQTQTRLVQTFRQCLFTDEEFKEEVPTKSDPRLFEACEDGSLPAVKRIISAYPEKIHAMSKTKLSPIKVAAKFGRTDVFNFLACHTHKWNRRQKFKNSILHFACIGGSLEIIKRVLSLRLYNIESRGYYNRTPLQMTVRYGHKDAAEMLIQLGSNVMVTDYLKSNMLHLACKSKNIAMLKYIMAKDIFSLESRTIDGETPLHVATARVFLEGCEYLIEQGADVTAVDKRQNTLLHHVLRTDRVTGDLHVKLMKYFVKILIELQPGKQFLRKINVVGLTAKQLARKRGFTEIVYILDAA